MVISTSNTFGKAPEPNNILASFFVENPDSTEAFKTHGVSILKSLTLEVIHTNMHDHLIPTLMATLGRGVLRVDNEDAQSFLLSEEAEIMAEAKSAFLNHYGLSKLTIHTIARWMHAVGFL